MVDKYELETFHRVYDNSDGVCIEVGRHPDDIDNSWFRIHTPNAESKKFYGDIELSLTKEQMKLLAKAMLLVVGE